MLTNKQRRELRLKHPRKFKLYSRKYYKNNKERYREYNKKHYKKYKVKMLLKMKKYVKKNREKLNKKKRLWYQRTKSVIRKRYKRSIHGKYLLAKFMAKQRKIEFKLSEIQYEKIVSNPCIYCHTVVYNVSGYSLDRINNSKKIGYTVRNVVPCCGSCNRIRGDNLTFEEMIIAMKAVLKFRKCKDGR
ncbi:MAG: hypothetical protein ACREBR_04470 [bacterium]